MSSFPSPFMSETPACIPVVICVSNGNFTGINPFFELRNTIDSRVFASSEGALFSSLPNISNKLDCA